MSTISDCDFLSVQPSELKFPFKLGKQSSCTLQLANKTYRYIAFKVKTTQPKKYCVRPNAGVVSPCSVCNITVTMQAQKEAPPDMQCKDKFQILSVVAPIGATKEDVSCEMFNGEDGKVVQQLKLSVGYDPANPPSVAKPLKPSSTRHSSSSEVKIDVSKSAEENNSVLLKQSQKLLEELELARKQIAKQQLTVMFLILVLIVVILVFFLGHLR